MDVKDKPILPYQHVPSQKTFQTEAETMLDSRATGSEETVPPPPELDSYMTDLGDSLELPEDD
eukprot:5027545-Pyramimonas_sp.AAC.1